MTLFEALKAPFFAWLAGEIQPFLGPSRPLAFRLEVTSQMGVAFAATAHLPTLATPNDVANRELTLSVNGTAQPANTVTPDTSDIPLGNFNLNDQLSASLVDIDGAGNRSVPRVETLVIADTVPPPEPGEFGFHVDQVFS